MKKGFILVICMLFMASLIGCDTPEQKGVLTVGEGNECYIIKLPDGKKASHYFTITNRMGTVVGKETDVFTYSNVMGSVSYGSVAEGGWIAYNESEQGCILYMPEGFPENRIAHACGMWMNNPDDYMTFEEAKELFAWLGT